MRQKVRIVVFLLTTICLFACQGEGTYPGMRTAEELSQYERLNDSMTHRRPQALSMIRQQMEQATDSLTWYDYYLMYGRHYLLTPKLDSLLPYVRRTLHYVGQLDTQTPRTRGLAATALNSLGAYHYMLYHDADSTIGSYMKAYELMQESDMKDKLPDLSANIADAYVEIGDMPSGAKWYRKALVQVDSLGLPKDKSLTLYMGLGRIYTTLHDFERAREYYEKTDREYDKMAPNMQSYFLNNYGNYFYYRQQYDEALQTFRRLKVHLNRYFDADYFDMYLCKINLADVFLNLHQTDSARYYLQQSEPFFIEKGIEAGIYYAQTIRIGIALEEKQYGDVQRILREETKMSIADEGMLNIRNKYMDRYYAAIGDYQRAYNAIRDNEAKEDSVEYSRTFMRSTDIMARLTEDTLRLHHELEKDRQQIKYEKTRTFNILMVAILIAAILGGLVWAQYHRKRYLQTRLDMLQLRMANARQRISPHFIFNVLNARIAKVGQKESEQLTMLAHLLRANLDLTQRTFVTLQEELDFVERYVELERQISGQDFDFTIDAPDKKILHETELPSMMIQIIAENAILHGLKKKEDEKRLCIKVEDLGSMVCISVCDNGPGFDIRCNCGERARTGLNIIRTTVSTLNMENKKTKIRFDIKNENGCRVSLTISKDIKYPKTTT
jgi:tetratricopeptide (TPR) repeat protein